MFVYGDGQAKYKEEVCSPMALTVPDQETIRRLCLLVKAAGPKWIQDPPGRTHIAPERDQEHEQATENKISCMNGRYDPLRLR